VIVDRRDLEASFARVRAEVRDPRGGIHGSGSAAWCLQRDAISFLGAGRAALLQLAHPFVAYAIDQHSKTRADVRGRFQRTFANVFAMSFGDLDEAFTAARRVHHIHTKIHGALPTDVGAFVAGTRYDANDADSLRWVWATLVHTVVHVRELVLGRVPQRLKDAYVGDAWQFARLFAIPEAMRPAGWAALDRYVAEMIASPVLTVAPPAREMARFLFGEGKTRLGRWLEVMTTGLLAPTLRRQYGLRWGIGERAVFIGSLAAIAPGWRILPRRARLLPAYVDAERRLAGRPPSSLARWMDRRFASLAALVAGSD
jgi:uncharacterized protein (DUF2236 family)